MAMENHHFKKRRYIFTCWIFHCYLSLPECNWGGWKLKPTILVTVLCQDTERVDDEVSPFSFCWNIIAGWWFQICFIFTPYLGKIPILTNMFQMGWNHHLDSFPARIIIINFRLVKSIYKPLKGTPSVHPTKLTQNPKMEVWKMIFLFN